MLSRLLGGALLLAASYGTAQQVPAWREDGEVLRQAVLTGEPFTVAGQRGVIVGQQQGEFEAWVLPVKLLSHFTIEADVEGYPLPIDLNAMAREIEVRPDHTTIIYSHIALTLRQTMFAPDETEDGTGAVVVFQVDAALPVDLVFRFKPELRKMWPALSSGQPSAEWVERGESGLYVLHSDFPDFAGAVALPGATYGVMAPYQERPQTHALEFRLHVDPKVDGAKAYPLLMAIGTSQMTATNAALEAKLVNLANRLPAIYTQHAERYRKRQNNLTQIVTPDAKLNRAVSWAETSIGQLQARTAGGEVGLVAGYYSSGDSARPGFGWFFGRDALYTAYAMDSDGDFDLVRRELEFLMARQRQDGKMMHEYSQTADEVDWKALPYEFAAADSTPLFLTALLDYVRTSGDIDFLKAHRDNVIRAWHFETTHDSDGDGIYDNAQGTGWVESWPTGMPRQEIYVALLDEQASSAMAQLGTMLSDGETAKAAADRAVKLHATIEREYYRPETDAYGFSWNAGKLDPTATIFPAIAWWNDGKGLDHAELSLGRWASHDFETDWGSRDVAASDPLYNSMSYHQGSVWPLFTGWEAMAQYRGGRALAGYQSTMQNVDLTFAQDLGAVTELLSGDFFEPFGRSTSHQLWSSAMVITPVLRGMFGISVDALDHSVSVTPRLPADWSDAAVKRLAVGSSIVDLNYKREGQTLLISLIQLSGRAVRLRGAVDGSVLLLPLPAVEVSVGHGLPRRGSRTTEMKVLNETMDSHSLRLELEGVAGSVSLLRVIRNDTGANVRATGGTINGDVLTVQFPAGAGYKTQDVILRW